MRCSDVSSKLTLNIEFTGGADVLGGNYKGVGSRIIFADVLQQQLVNQFVDDYVDAVGGCDGLAVLHPGSLDILLGEPDLQLSNVALADREIRQRLHQGHWAH